MRISDWSSDVCSSDLSLMATVASLGILAALSGPAMAHCDSMDGPVVQDAQRAIVEKNVTPVLKWVTQQDEEEIRSAFDMTLAVRRDRDKPQQEVGQAECRERVCLSCRDGGSTE